MGNDGESTKNIDKKLYIDMCWGLYQEHQSNARHHETQRSTVNNFIILLAGAMVTLIFAGGFARDDWFLSIAIMLLGGICAIFNILLYGRYSKHKHRAYFYRDAIDKELFGESKVDEEIKSVNDCKKPDRKTLRQIKNCADYERKAKLNFWNLIGKIEPSNKGAKKIFNYLASVHWLWFMLPMIVIALGILLLISSIKAPEDGTKPIRIIIENFNGA